MTEFLKILTHGRRLQGAVKELSVEELQEVAEKLDNVITKRKEQEAVQRAEEEKKRQLKEALLKQMQEAGIDPEELAGAAKSGKSKGKGQKRPIKYRYTDPQGQEHTWTGIGRTPKVFAELKGKGQLEQYRV
ncbi:DNA-binding protein H-NS [Saliniradius amylolyticus]|uniref:DNA-binding protein n=1 Tax=Saliniradius amylolyticus TaxID=2183582 RepID=A0A2S2E1I7_9ALTE|nr:H-NS family nucleoid-associated regulatory protein [Saliniradius amylolyticus]AWL11515.1 DNA-binding protein H-NS [Saliniradius amylolyticus]